MDPKMLKLLRVFLGVDDKLLPDSMSTEDFGKFIEEQKGKLFGNPEDFKNLQKIISRKDSDFTKTKAALEKLKSKKPKQDDKEDSEIVKENKALKKSIDEIGKKLDKINQASETEALTKKYPDILPEILVGKTEEEQKSIVDKQRTKNKKLYGDSKEFTQPTYDDVDDVDKKLDEVKDDKSMSGEKSAVETLKLGRVKEGLGSPESD